MSHEDNYRLLRLMFDLAFSAFCMFAAGGFIGYRIGWLQGVDDECKERNRGPNG